MNVYTKNTSSKVISDIFQFYSFVIKHCGLNGDAHILHEIKLQKFQF